MVLLYGALDRFVPELDRAAMREALRACLHEQRPEAAAAAARLATDEGHRLWRLVESQHLQELAPQLEALVRDRRDELAALSPRGRLAALGVPVYLAHGSGDTVIPPRRDRLGRARAGRGRSPGAGVPVAGARRGQRDGRPG